MRHGHLAQLCFAVLACSVCASGQTVPAINDDVEEPLKLFLKRPWYRNTIFASLPMDTIEVEAYPSLHIIPSYVVGSRLDLEIIGADDQVLASTSVKNGFLTFLIRAEIEVGDLPYGDYEIVARLYDSNGELIQSVHKVECVDSTPLRKLPPAAHEVTFDDHGICRVNGERFFPIGMYHIWPNIRNYMNSIRQNEGLEPLDWAGWYGKLRDAGFNSFNDWQSGREPEELRARYTIARELGFNGQVHPNSDRDVEVLAAHGGVLGWYTSDEPVLRGVRVEDLREMYAHYMALDPYHPQFIADNSPNNLAIMAPFTDVLMLDLYPQHNGDMRIMGRSVAEARKLNGGHAIVWSVVQAFQLSRYATNPDGSTYSFGRLDSDEMRAITYDGIICGATGVFYYAYYTSEGPQDLPGGGTRKDYMIDDYPDQWAAIRRINGELADLAPALTSGRTLATLVAPVESDVHAATFVDGHRAIVMVVNPSREEQSVVIGVPGFADQVGEDLFGPDAVVCKHSQMALKLAPLAAGAYAFILP